METPRRVPNGQRTSEGGRGYREKPRERGRERDDQWTAGIAKKRKTSEETENGKNIPKKEKQ